MTTPAHAELNRLRRMGFQQQPILGEDGAVEVVYYMREHGNSPEREVVLVYNEHQARAYRTHSIADDGDPFYVAPDSTLLIPLADVVTVVHKLLSTTPSAGRHALNPDPTTPPEPMPAPTDPDTQMALLLRQTQWMLGDLAFHLPTGGVLPENRVEAAEILEAIATFLRARPPTVIDSSTCTSKTTDHHGAARDG